MADEKKVEEVKKETRKNMSWKYSATDHVLTAVFPSGTEKNYNLSNRVHGMAFSDELIYQYGIRQWLSSNAAAEKEEEDKIASFRRDFNEFMEKGLELSEGGTKISVVGRERANSSEAGATRKLQKEVASTAISMVDLTQKLLSGTITPEETAKLQELMSAAKTLGEKVKK